MALHQIHHFCIQCTQSEQGTAIIFKNSSESSPTDKAFLGKLIVPSLKRNRWDLQGAVASGCPGGPPRVCLDRTHSLWCKRTDLWVAALDLHCPHRAHPGCLGGGLDSARGRREAAVAYRKPPYRTLPRVRPCERVSSWLRWVVACRHALDSWQSLSQLCLLQHTPVPAAPCTQ